MPTWRDDDAMAADDDVVADLHEVVDLGALADHRVAAGAPVDGGVGADLDVVLDDDAADLRHLEMALAPHGEAEAVLADAAPAWRITRLPISALASGGAGGDRAVAADAHLRPDDRLAPITVPDPISAPGPITAPGSTTTPCSSRAVGCTNAPRRDAGRAEGRARPRRRGKQAPDPA